MLVLISNGSSFQKSIAVMKKHDLDTGPGLLMVWHGRMSCGLLELDLVVLVFVMSRSVFWINKLQKVSGAFPFRQSYVRQLVLILYRSLILRISKSFCLGSL